MKVIQGYSERAEYQAATTSHPTAGQIVNAEDFLGRRPAARKTPRHLFVGRQEGREEYLSRKSAARASLLFTSEIEHQQPDAQTSRNVTAFNSPRLPADFPALSENDSAPFDCTIACGPSHLLTAAGDTCALFDKAGALHWWCDLNEWFASAAENISIYHTRVMYDQFSGRWFIAACARALKGRGSWLLLSVSQTRSPLGIWMNQALEVHPQGNLTAEGLGLGVDYEAIYLTANLFDAKAKFQTALVRILPKSSFLSGGEPEMRDFTNLKNPDGTPAFSLQPAHTFGTPGVEYLLNATSDGRSLTQWNLTQPLSEKPLLTQRTVPTVHYQLAPDAVQPADASQSAQEIDTGDTRLTGLIFRHGHLWTAHTVAAHWEGETNQSAIQWFQINAGTRLVAQQRIYGRPGMDYFCPAMMVDGQSNLIMVFNRSSSEESVSLRFTGRLSTDLPNLLHSSALLHEGVAPGVTTWGGYNGAAVDTNDMKVWVVGQYGAGSQECRTWIGETSYITSRAEGGAISARRSAPAR